MVERLEKTEMTEQTMDPEVRQALIDTYKELGREAAAAGYSDMAGYYEEKASELESGDEKTAELTEADSDRQGSQAGTDMKAYYEAKKEKIAAEKQQREQQLRMDKAVHGAPDYSGFGGWRESEYLYEAEKEYAKNGDSAEYRRLMEGAAKAHIREKYEDILE